MIPTRFFSPTLAMVAALLSGTAASAPIVYFGEQTGANGSVTGAPVDARSAFLAGLAANVRNEGFENVPTGSYSSLGLTFTGSSGNLDLGATLTGTGAIFNTAAAGRFNTTPGGSKLFEVSGPFAIDFGNTPISAFGFYATDVGDFGGQLTITLTDKDGNELPVLTVPNSTGSESTANAALLFWGFIDAGNSYKTIVFGNTKDGIDIFGFDDMVVGDLGQVRPPNGVPEPISLALVGTALFGLAVARRRLSAS